MAAAREPGRAGAVSDRRICGRSRVAVCGSRSGLAGDAPPAPAPYEDPLAGIAEQAFGAEIECLQERVSVLLDGAPLRWGASAVMTLVDEAYTRPLHRLWARGWAAAFNQLKLDGRLGLDARVSHLTSAQRALVVATARDRYSRLNERMGAMRDALLGRCGHYACD
ncbi:hypothetical protein ACFQS6_15180 [Xanthomonas populi]